MLLWLYVYVCTYVCTCMYVYTYACVCIHIQHIPVYIQLHKHVYMYTHPDTHLHGLSCPVCALPDTSHMTFQKRKGQRTTPADHHATRPTPVLLAIIMIKPHRNQRTHFKSRSSILIWPSGKVHQNCGILLYNLQGPAEAQDWCVSSKTMRWYLKFNTHAGSSLFVIKVS